MNIIFFPHTSSPLQSSSSSSPSLLNGESDGETPAETAGAEAAAALLLLFPISLSMKNVPEDRTPLFPPPLGPDDAFFLIVSKHLYSMYDDPLCSVSELTNPIVLSTLSNSTTK
ncbi:ORF1013 [White spot syndrome virus]|uniref:ORF1013 n=1 Tax=White spot syndrome virus TaxID=342409 RepID=A0A2D3I5B9_9VIRU|nr:ORF1013 [White spot syndrome virus]